MRGKNGHPQPQALSLKGEGVLRQGHLQAAIVSDSPTKDLEAIAERIRDALAVKHQARERAYTLSRQVIRNAANSIRAVHRGELEVTRELLATAGALLSEMVESTAEHPDLRFTGYMEDAQKEFAEASITVALVSRTPVPAPEELGITNSAYLNGIGEAASEMRRHLLDSLRRDEVAHCEEVLSSMDDIYNVLVTIDFPDALTGGLRRTTDMLRAVLERTRGDLTLALVQNRLGDRLARAEERLPE